MALADLQIPSVVGGITQQPQMVARPDKAQDIENFLPLPEAGLIKRAGTRWLSRIFADPSPEVLAIPIDLGGDEKYVAVASNENVTVLLSDGREIPVFEVTRDADGAITGGTDPDFSYLDLRTPNELSRFTGPSHDPEGFSTWATSGAALSVSPGDGPASPLGFRDTSTNPAADAFTSLRVSAGTSFGEWNLSFTGWQERRLRFSVYVNTAVSGFTNADRIGLRIFSTTNSWIVNWDFGGSYDTLPTPLNTSADGSEFLTHEERLGPNLFRLSFLYDPDRVVGTKIPEGSTAWGPFIRVGEPDPTAISGFYCWGALLEQDPPPDEPTPGAYALPPETLRVVQAVDTTLVANPLIPTRVDATQTSSTFATVYGSATFPGVGGGAAETVAVSDAGYVFVRQVGGVSTSADFDVTLIVTDPALGDVTISTTFHQTAGEGTTEVADTLATNINAHASNTDTGLGGNTARIVLATAVGSVVKLECKGGGGTTVTIKELRTADGLGDLGMTSWHNETESISDLPLTAQHDTRVTLTEAEDAPDDIAPAQVVLRFKADAGEGFGQGFWVEGVDYGLRIAVDSLTLPHRLVRRQDDSSGTVTGTERALYFEWNPFDYDDRLVGDDAVNGLPSFVTPEADEDVEDRFVTAISFYKDRLVLASSVETIAFSEVSRYGNFWRTTVQTIPDSDRIDVGISSSRASKVSDLVVGSERLFVLAGESILVVTTGEVLSPRAIGLDQVHAGSVASFPQSSPVLTGFAFATEGRDFDSLHIGIPTDEANLVALDPSDEVPRLLPSPTERLQWCDTLSALFVGSREDRSSLHALRFLGGSDVRQSAWFRLSFGAAGVHSFAVLGCDLFLLLDRGDGLHLERLPVEEHTQDAGQEWAIALDRRVSSDSLSTAPSYSTTTDKTTFTLPYEIEAGATMSVVRRDAGGFGVELTVDSTGTTTVVVDGDQTAADVFLGQSFLATYRPLYPLLRNRLPRGGFAPSPTARQVAKRGTMLFSRTGFASVRVIGLDGSSFDHEFDNEGASGVTLEDRELRFGVLSPPEDADVQLRSFTHKPTSLAALAWEMEIVDRGAKAAL